MSRGAQRAGSAVALLRRKRRSRSGLALSKGGGLWAREAGAQPVGRSPAGGHEGPVRNGGKADSRPGVGPGSNCEAAQAATRLRPPA